MTTDRAAALVCAAAAVIMLLVLLASRRATTAAEYEAWRLRTQVDSLRTVARLHEDRADAFRGQAEDAVVIMDSLAAVVEGLKARGPVVITRTQVIHDALRSRPAPLDSLWHLLVPE